MYTAGDPFESSMGIFWSIPETRDYMRARTALIDALRSGAAAAALLVVLQHLQQQYEQ